jgi:hypothetical protein
MPKRARVRPSVIAVTRNDDAWLPARAARCNRYGEKSVLPGRFPHRGAQALVGAIVGAKRIAVHNCSKAARMWTHWL